MCVCACVGGSDHCDYPLHEERRGDDQRVKSYLNLVQKKNECSLKKGMKEKGMDRKTLDRIPYQSKGR